MTNTEIPQVEGSLMDPAVQSCPFDFYRQLHERSPVYRMPETGFYVVSMYEDVRRVLGDTETFSSRSGASAELQSSAVALHQRILDERGWKHVATLQRTDPPEHGRYRRLVNRVFTQRRVKEELAPKITQVTDELIDTFLIRGRCEFVSEFALPLPGLVIAEQLGLGRDQIATFKRWADAMLAPATRLLNDAEVVEVAEAELEAQHHFASVFEERRANPTGDLMSALVHSHVEGEQPLTMHELQNLMHQLVTGGFETTTSAIAHGMWLLLRHRDQMARLRTDPDRLMRGFVEEVLRIESPVQGLSRRTTQDVELHGSTIPAGSVVLVRYGAANRDETEFEHADVFDITRPNSASHVAFGLGPHFCVGAALARQELTTAFSALLSRLDDIELAEPVPQPAHHPSLYLFPLKELQLRFTPKA